MNLEKAYEVMQDIRRLPCTYTAEEQEAFEKTFSLFKEVLENSPLSLDELRLMSGKPVYVKILNPEKTNYWGFENGCYWSIVEVYGTDVVICVDVEDGAYFTGTTYNESWIAYRKELVCILQNI